MSILSLGNSYKADATAGFRQLANLETNRERTNENIAFQNDEMKKQKQTAAIGGALTGAAMGATYGAALWPAGIVGGAVAGYFMNSLF